MILVTGTGRCGTGWAAQVLVAAGVRCTHEGIFKPRPWEESIQDWLTRKEHPEWGWEAESSWLAAPFLGRPELGDCTVVHLVRHPKKVIDSHLRLMLYTHPHYGEYFRWMRPFLPELDRYARPEDKAAVWYLRLNEMAARRADIFQRVEDGADTLLEKLGIAGPSTYMPLNYNMRSGFGPSDVQLDEIAPQLREELLAMTDRYGYVWSQGDTWLIGTLYDSMTVRVSPLAAGLGGAWQMRDAGGKPLAYDPALVKFFANKVQPGDLIVDIGASSGSFSLLPLVHDCRVEAFEPNPLAVKALRANLRLNGITDRVQVHEVALFDRSGAGVLQVPYAAVWAAVSCLEMGRFRREDVPVQPVPVQMARLDDYRLAPDLLKIDVEGAELPVLRGAERTITEHKPGILVEYTSENTRQFAYEREAIVDWLRARGYDTFRQVGIEDLWAE